MFKLNKHAKVSPYGDALVIELFAGIVRFVPLFLIFLFFFELMFYISYQSQYGEYAFYNMQVPPFNGLTAVYWAFVLSLIISYGNIPFSIVGFFGMGSGGYWTRFVLGAREASTREIEELNQFLKQVVSDAQNRGIKVKSFSKFYVLDSPMTFANVIGSTLYISSGTFGSRYFQALLVHELAHLHQGLGREVLAARRLVSPVFQIFVGDVRSFATNRPDPRPEIREFEAAQVFYSMVNKIIFFFLALFGGGLGVYLLSWQWAGYFRWRDYTADSFAAKLGYKDILLEYLEETKFYDSTIPYMLNWSPSSELRIDALLHPAIYGLKVVENQVDPPNPAPSRMTRAEASLDNPDDKTEVATLTQEHKQMVKQAAEAKAKATGVPVHSIYRKLREPFGVRNFEAVPDKDFDELMKNLQDM